MENSENRALLLLRGFDKFLLGVFYVLLSSVCVSVFVDTDWLAIFPLTILFVSIFKYEGALALKFAVGETSNVGLPIRILKGALSLLVVVFEFAYVDCSVWMLSSPKPIHVMVSVFSLVDKSIRKLVHGLPVKLIIFKPSLPDMAILRNYSSRGAGFVIYVPGFVYDLGVFETDSHSSAMADVSARQDFSNIDDKIVLAIDIVNLAEIEGTSWKRRRPILERSQLRSQFLDN